MSTYFSNQTPKIRVETPTDSSPVSVIEGPPTRILSMPSLKGILKPGVQKPQPFKRVTKGQVEIQFKYKPGTEHYEGDDMLVRPIVVGPIAHRIKGAFQTAYKSLPTIWGKQLPVVEMQAVTVERNDKVFEE